ncbi:DUF2913 family protein [Vibrio quintilis]|uniref:DUF2913 family protein n=1 Tax=Vibrio quintilis TaxID=1117707 RepID=UPI0021C9CAC0|nr:DUF2913 family protein [Vibrio quintilis]
MNNAQYHSALSVIATNALLHLYFEIAYQERFFPVNQRNATLSKWLKLRLKFKQYACIKKEIKILIILGRKKCGDIESKLWELSQITENYKSQLTDADDFYYLLSRLLDEYNYNSHLFEPEEKLKPDAIYIENSVIEHCFDDDGKLKHPITGFMKTESPGHLVSVASKLSDTYVFALTRYGNGIAHYSISLR